MRLLRKVAESHFITIFITRFEKTLSMTINYIVYVQFNNGLEIDSSRQVIIDFSD